MEQPKLNIYPQQEKWIEGQFLKLRVSELSPRNKELLSGFQTHLYARGSGRYRVAKLCSQFRLLCLNIKNDLKIDKDLDNLTMRELEALVSHLNRGLPRSDITKADYRRALKQFFLYFKREDNRVYSPVDSVRIERIKFYEYIEKDLKTKFKSIDIDPKTIITEEIIENVIDKGCKTNKEKAFISHLHETGQRTGEILNQKIGDFVFKENFGEVTIRGKTGQRTIQFVKSLPYILKWLEIHPDKNNKNAYVWLSSSNRRLNEPLLHAGIQELINFCFERAGYKTTRHNLHWFRHSRASILATKMTEQMLCMYMGWSIGSHQVKTYTHISPKQLQDVFLSINGLAKKEEDISKPIPCPSCRTLNPPRERYCFKCCRPLNVEVVLQDKTIVDSEIGKTMNYLLEIAKNPELMKAFESFKKEYKP